MGKETDTEARIKALKEQIAAAEEEIEDLLEEKRKARRNAVKHILEHHYGLSQKDSERALRQARYDYVEYLCGDILGRLSPFQIGTILAMMYTAPPFWNENTANQQ
ncbi:MAG: hypothetical protein IKF39_04205 [Oscillospiraceae bacterium]|nr:hypothetical protein [Oscillospiraceae bacterium]